MDKQLKLWKVRQLEYNEYTDYEGAIVIATTQQRAKEIVLDRFPYWEELGVDNIVVDEVELVEERLVTTF